MKTGRCLLSLMILNILTFSPACSPAARSAAANSIATAATNTNGVSQAKLMLFGGEDHRTYLGCLNCSEYSIDSVFNQYGSYGSRYSITSIWNHYGEAGSRYSSHGACNAYANDPPVIVDSDGNYYGRMTLNAYHPQIGYGTRFFEWLSKTVCED